MRMPQKGLRVTARFSAASCFYADYARLLEKTKL